MKKILAYLVVLNSIAFTATTIVSGETLPTVEVRPRLGGHKIQKLRNTWNNIRQNTKERFNREVEGVKRIQWRNKKSENDKD